MPEQKFGPSLIHRFSALEDPRQSWKMLFPLPEVLSLMLRGTLARAEDFAEIRHYLDDPAAAIRSRFETTDGDRGRIEVRRRLVSHDAGLLTADRRFPGEPRVPGPRAIATVQAEVERDGGASLERHRHLSSMPLDAKPLAHAVRSRWHVENSLHRVLDAVFHEDLSRLRSGAWP